MKATNKYLLRLKKAISEVYKLNEEDLENYYLLKVDYSKWSDDEKDNLILLIRS